MTTRHNEARQEGDRWMTTRQMADHLRISEKTLLRLAREHLIPCWRYGQIVRFQPDAVERALCRPGMRG